TSVIAVGAGGRHSLAVKSDGTVWGWGLNTDGQVGIGNVQQVRVPTQVAGNTAGFVAVTGGTTHSMALRGDGTIWVWGKNDVGQFGLNTPASTTVPIPGPTGFAV